MTIIKKVSKKESLKVPDERTFYMIFTICELIRRSQSWHTIIILNCRLVARSYIHAPLLVIESNLPSNPKIKKNCMVYDMLIR